MERRKSDEGAIGVAPPQRQYIKIKKSMTSNKKTGKDATPSLSEDAAIEGEKKERNNKKGEGNHLWRERRGEKTIINNKSK